ncbi:hypothetical protein GGR28_001642 [Lewinella aquimaris]|uniref:Glycosyltransferase involved in cell wall biosynthesis n=1 Tax=Neolewinella aquimaris TaxID=1835722 RepID=A0A840E5Y1_9BACT|nr:hypothetical protein [Neolewinella aquimaris]MBB4079025.1 hypothetical protein [Neolewinella aquimaris]
MKRIQFFCGSLAPGKDGVGDYTRRLAAELIGMGYAVAIVATHDKVTPELVSGTQAADGTSVSVVRIPYATTENERTHLLQAAIDEFDPDWLSLQYVPYSFNAYGLPLSFARKLRTLRNRGKWHVMFHELWIDQRGLLTPKDTTISLLQRLAAVAVVRSLRPEIRHTHLPGYQNKLRSLGIQTQPLPLFPNISPVNRPVTLPSQETFRLGFFSQMDLREEILTLIRKLMQWTDSQQKTLEIFLMGGSESKSRETSATLNELFPGATIHALGFMPSEEISQIMASLNLGITPVPYHAIGKSGTVAAFLSHGVPVAAPWKTERSPSFFSPELTAAVLQTFSAPALRAATEAAAVLDTTTISVQGVARRFTADLGLAPSHQPTEFSAFSRPQ